MSTAEESILRASIDNLLEGVQVIGFDWTYRYVNETATKHGQRSARELLGRNMRAVYPGIESTEMFQVLERVMRTRKAERMLNEFTFPTGERRWFQLVIDPVPTGLCVLSLDVTDSELAEQRLRQAQKLEAIGQLAGGIAHDFNNILTAILGYSELLTQQIGPDKPIGRDLQEIVAAAERASTLTRQLLAFSRGQEAKPEPISLHATIAKIEPMLRRLIPENVAIGILDRAERDTIDATAIQVEQILINLVVNARDAMPSGGHVAIGTTNAAGQAGESVVLSVQDTGSGMSPEVRARIFEPFFTTKGPAQGTGLGLVAVKDIVGQLHGQIRVTSAEGAGTTFEILLPVTERPAVREVRGVAQSAPGVGHETILLVEDEAGVRSFVSTVLKRYGYRVLESASAEAALVETPAEARVDLLLADLVLPGMNGAELVRALRARRPKLPALLMSGYAHPPGITVPADVSILGKPFTAGDVLDRVRQALD